MLILFYHFVKGNPPPVVTWYKDGVLHEYNQRSWSSQDDLIISNFDQSDVGDYKCRAENILGVTDSDTAKIELKCKFFFELCFVAFLVNWCLRVNSHLASRIKLLILTQIFSNKIH